MRDTRRLDRESELGGRVDGLDGYRWWGEKRGKEERKDGGHGEAYIWMPRTSSHTVPRLVF